MSRRNGRIRLQLTTAAVFTAAVIGCAKPNAANIALRKQVQDQQDVISRLSTQHSADMASMRAATQPTSGPAVSPEQLGTLYTAHGIRLGKLTGISGNHVLTVHLIPTDQDGDDFKASGSITIDAYDLADHGREVLRQAFGVADAMKFWNGTGLRYEYVIPCPLPAAPGSELTVRVTFVDALTSRSFEAQQVVQPPSE